MGVGSMRLLAAMVLVVLPAVHSQALPLVPWDDSGAFPEADAES